MLYLMSYVPVVDLTGMGPRDLRLKPGALP